MIFECISDFFGRRKYGLRFCCMLIFIDPTIRRLCRCYTQLLMHRDLISWEFFCTNKQEHLFQCLSIYSWCMGKEIILIAKCTWNFIPILLYQYALTINVFVTTEFRTPLGLSSLNELQLKFNSLYRYTSALVETKSRNDLDNEFKLW